MDETAFEQHLGFYLPPRGSSSARTLQFPPELTKIFYIARVVFSETSMHRIKSQASPLLDREEVFSAAAKTAAPDSETTQKARMDNFISLAKISSISDIAHLLPREHLIYAENMFYKKLANRELIRIDYRRPTGGIISVDSFFPDSETELKRSQKVYLLFDNSTSMNGEKFKKLYVAKAIAIEYLRRVSREQPQIYFRTFHSETGELIKASTGEQLHRLVNHIAQVSTGGGRITIIGDAVVQAIEDIKSDPDLEEAEILVLTDGFGPIPKDLKEKLGSIKLHVILIPDLDIEKILKMYPDRAAWEQGGPDGAHPMPSFWRYYSSKPPPTFLDGDELYQDSYRSYETASKSVKELKVLEILQGLNQIYCLQDVCQNFIFVVITSILGEDFAFTLEDLVPIQEGIQALSQMNLDDMNPDEKLAFLERVTFLMEFIKVAKSNIKDKQAKRKLRGMESSLAALQARILEDPWIRSILKVDRIKLKLSRDMIASRKKDEQMSPLAAFSFLLKYLWQQARDALRQLRYSYRL